MIAFSMTQGLLFIAVVWTVYALLAAAAIYGLYRLIRRK